MENKPAIIVSGSKNNMQPWYEENASEPWKNWPTLRTPSAAPVMNRMEDGRTNRRKCSTI